MAFFRAEKRFSGKSGINQTLLRFGRCSMFEPFEMHIRVPETGREGYSRRIRAEVQIGAQGDFHIETPYPNSQC